MQNIARHQIMLLPTDWISGDENAPEQLMSLIYDELRRQIIRFSQKNA